MSQRYETVFVHVGCVAFETDAALLLEDGSDLWIPKSQIRKESEVLGQDDEGILAIPRWLAEEKGLRYTEKIMVNQPAPEGAVELETKDDYVEPAASEPAQDQAPAPDEGGWICPGCSGTGWPGPRGEGAPCSTCGGVGKRSAAELEELDVCPTPAELALAICKLLRERHGDVKRILEPSAGEGAFVAAARQVWPNAHITAIEIRSECRTSLLAAGANDVCIGGLLAVDPVSAGLNTFDLVLGNPPFAEAEEHIRLLLAALRAGVPLSFLLRLGFFESFERVNFWKDYPEDELDPIVPRPSFKKNKHGKKGTDSQSYGLFSWTKLEVPFTVGARTLITAGRRHRGDHIVWRDPEKADKPKKKKKKARKGKGASQPPAAADATPPGASAPPASSAAASPEVTEGPVFLE